MSGEIGGSTYGESVPEKSGTGWDRIPIRTTLPDEVLRHNVSDEELDMLGETKRGFFHEFMWAVITGAIGAAPAALHDLGRAFLGEHTEVISAFELFEILLFSGFLILAAFSAFLCSREGKKDPKSLKEKIRARTRSEAQG